MQDSSNQSNSKRIAKNTILLYCRMLLSMIITLYTSRIFLQALGVVDYGIYNVVGGFVAMFGLLSGSLNASISRYLTYELGKGDINNLKKVFSTSITIQVLLSLIIVVIVETFGVWYLNNLMVIPKDRLFAANCVLQLSIITFVVNLVSIPYNATIISHEHMNAFAFVGIGESFMRLCICFFVLFSTSDKLIVYALLIALLSIIIRVFYGYYCKRHFEECSYSIVLDKILLKRMFSFASWNFIGSGSGLLRDQGVNLIINYFCGPSVNAARGIAMQVNSAVQQFSSNFLMALNPQITKRYASGEREYAIKLVFYGSRFSLYLLLIISLPVILETDYILHIWLNNVPDYASSFVKLILAYSMIEAVSGTMITLMLANGNIKNYQIIVGGCQLLNFPLALVALYLGYTPESTIIISMFVGTLCMVFRLIMLNKMVNFPIKQFLINVYLNVCVVALMSSLIPYYLSYTLNVGLMRFVTVTLSSVLSTTIMIYFVGCNSIERNLLNNRFRIIFQRITK